MAFGESLLCTIFFALIAGTVAVDLERNVLKTWKNSRYYGFRGIRYAEPPTGPRRFTVDMLKIEYPCSVSDVTFISGSRSDRVVGKLHVAVRKRFD